jgi:hypothetical protein
MINSETMSKLIQVTSRLGKWSSKSIATSWEPTARFLVLPGEFGNPLERTFHSRVRALTNMYDRVVLVPGLRELHSEKHIMSEMFSLLYSAAERNPKLEILNNRAIDLDSISVFGSTMWLEKLKFPLPLTCDRNEELIPLSKDDLVRLHRYSWIKYLAWKKVRPKSSHLCVTRFPLPNDEHDPRTCYHYDRT